MPNLLLASALALAVVLAAIAMSFMRSRSRRQHAFLSVDTLRRLSWGELEILVADYFVREGFAIRQQGGQAVDFVMERNGKPWLVQCKHWRNRKVDAPEVKDLFGHMAAAGARGASLLTVGSFSRAAVDFASGKRIELIDGPALLKLIEEVQQDPSDLTRSRLNALRDAEQTQPRRVVLCPRCGRPMSRRQSRTDGKDFYGCSRYPTCKGRRDIA